ncbi:CLUMA_CG018888, isoform A [Clunio marinus]|uniref:Structural maintenance of chromosomes protein n=1 Tax=Clunio marinus TaxID=568069 RepID=A0A1J1J2N8_9DIPT|nr:CLUMA_CG018888, isoform A [Clunio marinus]
MLFVFGYRAQQIRSKKLSVLIHNSMQFPNVNSCKVAVHFQQIVDMPDGTFEFIPNTEIVVARTAFKNNSSFYSINDREVKFKEVAKLLQTHNIDLLHNRFLILQGEVESIALMKPKAINSNETGLLEYLEDIIGTERYKKPLMLINERLDKLNDERTEKHNRCRLADREMKDWELPMTQAVEFLKLENQLYQAQNLHWQLYIFHKKKEIVELEEVKDVAKQALKEHDEKYEEFKKLLLEKEKIIKDELNKHDELVSKLEECKTLEAKARETYQRVDAKMKSTNNRRKELKKQVESDEKKLEALESLPERNRQEIEESQKQIERLNVEKSELDTKLAENMKTLVHDTKSLRDEKEPLERELGELKAVLDKRKADYSEAQKELEIIQKDETAEVRKYESLRNSFEESKVELKKMKDAFVAAQESIPQNKRELQEKQQNFEQLQEEETKLVAELKKARLKFEENRFNFQAAQTNNRVLNALLKEKQKGKIPGILGRLGDLGAIDAKYDVAISTCCSRLDNIVVEDIDTAQQCINFLKANNIGRATFIALEKVQHLMSQANIQRQYPQNVSRLYDLIRVEDERVLPAFYFSLFETLIANDMEQARTIAYGQTRYRVVTLKGDVIEKSGTMSGGGKTQMRGRMGQKVQMKTTSRNSLSEQDLESLSQSAQRMQGVINDLQRQQGVLDKEIKELVDLIRKKELEVSHLQTKVKCLSEQIPRLEYQVNKQKERADATKSDPAKTAALNAKVEECKVDFENKESEVDAIDTKVKALNKQIKEISDKKVKEVKMKIEKLEKQIEKLASNVNKLTVEINTSDRNLKKATERIESTKQEITEAENSMRAMAEEREQIKTDIEDLKERMESLGKEIENASGDSSSIKKEIAKLQKEEADGKIKRLELDDKLKAAEKNLKEQSARIPAWENKIKSLKLHDIPNKTTPDPQFKTFSDDELIKKSLDDVKYEITTIEEKLVLNKPNLSAIEEYNKKQTIYVERIKNLEDVTMKRDEMRNALDNVKKKRFTEFSQGFQIISRKLKEMYQMITLGGDAELELVDSMDPFTEGVVFSVRPPKKSWKVITNLSGGEKTLSSLALVFALHYYKPSPLYFMDEIDAALDFKNVSIVANYINERTKNAQFIIISLRSNLFEVADHLVGIYKVKDCTKSVTIENVDKQRVAGVNKENDRGDKENQQSTSINEPSMVKETNNSQSMSVVDQSMPSHLPLNDESLEKSPQ